MDTLPGNLERVHVLQYARRTEADGIVVIDELWRYSFTRYLIHAVQEEGGFRSTGEKPAGY